MRAGLGIDVHRFGGSPPLVLCGVVVADDVGLEGTSDADVGSHAVSDALLGAAAAGDLGDHFPSADERWSGADSIELLRKVVEILTERGWEIGNVDVTVVSQSVPIAPHRRAMRENLAAVLGTDVAAISVKATTTDRMGTIGRDEGIAAIAIATVTAR